MYEINRYPDQFPRCILTGYWISVPFSRSHGPAMETALLARAGLGILQSPGCMTKPHLFFSIRSDGHPKFKRLRRRYDLKDLVSQANLTSSHRGRLRWLAKSKSCRVSTTAISERVSSRDYVSAHGKSKTPTQRYHIKLKLKVV